MSNRREVRLGEVATVTMGQSPRGEDCNRTGVGVPLLNGPTEFGPRSPTPAQWTSDPRRMAAPGDVLFCVRGSTTGRMNVADQPYAIGRGVASIRAKGSAYDTLLLRHLLWLGLPRLLAVTTGSTFPNLSKSDLESFTFDWPDSRDRNSISQVLGVLDDKHEINQQLATCADELAHAEFTSALKLGETIQKLSNVADVTMGASPPGSSYNNVGDGLPFFQGTRDFGFRFPANRVYCTQPKRFADPGDVLVSVRAPVGRLNVAVERCVIGRGVAAVTSDLPSCVYHGLRASSDAWEPYESEGTVFGSINSKALKAIPLRWPTAGINELERVLAPLDSLVVQLLRENQQLAELRDTLLPKLLSGELRLAEADGELEEIGL